MTADESAERLGMKAAWVWAQATAGRIRHVRLGAKQSSSEPSPPFYPLGLAQRRISAVRPAWLTYTTVRPGLKGAQDTQG
jgi:hypothetical protein